MEEDVFNKIEKLREEYEYWFEVFRREKDPIKREEARQKYKPAISEIIRLQEKYQVSSVPKYSSAERVRMDIDHQKKKLELSQEQVYERTMEIAFNEEKNRTEEDLRRKIEEQGDKYINGVIREMREHNLDISKIEAVLKQLDPKSLSSELEQTLRIRTLSLTLPFYFIIFYSGDIFIEDFSKKYSQAIKDLEDDKLPKAEEIIQEAMSLYDKAAQLTRFSSGKEYFRMEKERRISEWEATKNKIQGEKYHQFSQERIKKIISETIKLKPGILQTDLYKMISDYPRSEVSEAAYYLSREGKLRREKKGATFRLFLD
jgi:hypothetical protein